ncbi:hypothetical protein [uncultured Ellagibacter sp.]|uniref:hypothetical protein n=1 Tax=uncultured Ellagibacter sp. TaxID=2137580 RepID=UPI002611CAE8|nr:hypothetical protein [uncultured Ellagibacter sp.]
MIGWRITVLSFSGAHLLWYGSDQYGVADHPRSKGIPVHVYPAKGRGSLCRHDGGGDR